MSILPALPNANKGRASQLASEQTEGTGSAHDFRSLSNLIKKDTVKKVVLDFTKGNDEKTRAKNPKMLYR